MAPAEYSAVQQDEGPGDDSPAHTNYPPEAIKPVTYYGEGDFDPPSSDDEQETFLEKSLSRKPNGSADGMENGGIVDDGELVIGGKVLCSVVPIDTTCSHLLELNRSVSDQLHFGGWLSVLSLL
jgi:hypothetical protein